MIYTLNTRVEMYNNLPKGGVGAEIGVCLGYNAAHLLIMSKPKVLYLVDTWDRDKRTEENHPIELRYNDWTPHIKNMFCDQIDSGQIIVRKEKSLDFLSSLKDRSLDWIYLDGDHTYDVIRAELELCVDKVRKGGVIAGHDFIAPSFIWSAVSRAVLEFAQDGLIKVECLSLDHCSSFFARVI